MVTGSFPDNLTPLGTQGQIRKSPVRLLPRRKDGYQFQPTLMDAPGNSTLKEHCSRMDPVTQSHQAEMLGDICWREHPPWRRTQIVTPIHIWSTCCAHQHDRLKRCHMKWPTGQYQGRRLGLSWVRGCRSQMLSTTGPQPPGTPEWG